MGDRRGSLVLCEGCGYDLGGVGVGVGCPECGREASVARGDRRVGSAFQRGMGARSLVRTWWGVLTRSAGGVDRGVWGEVAVEWRRSGVLLLVSLACAGVLAWVGLVSVALTRGFLTPVHLLGVMTEAVLILGGLTVMEFFGIQLVGRKNGWRVTPVVAWAVCCHASVGWLSAGVGFGLGWVFGQLLPAEPVVPSVGWLPYAVRTPAMLCAIGCGFVGLLHFEFLVWRGVRACKFANVTRGGGVGVGGGEVV